MQAFEIDSDITDTEMSEYRVTVFLRSLVGFVICL